MNQKDVEVLKENVKHLKCYLLMNYPFWGTIISNLKVIFDENLPSYGATDGKDIILHPKCKDLSPKDLKFVVLHELLHVVFMHALRMQGRIHYLWNVACDLAVNHILTNEMDVKPENLEVLVEKKYAKLSAEVIYSDLLSKSKVQSFDSFSGSRRLTPDDLRKNTNVEDTQYQIREIIVQAYLAEQMRGRKIVGNLPDSVVTLIKEIIEPKIPFERFLCEYVSQVVSGKNEYSYNPINKKMYWFEEVVLPSISKEEVPNVVVAIDTSGSISEEELKIFAGGIKKLSTLTPSLNVVTCDCKIQQVIKAEEIESFLRGLSFKGGGGTSHVPVFEFIDKNFKEVDLVICFTDGETEFPSKKPKYPVLWVMTTNLKAPWGKVVRISS